MGKFNGKFGGKDGELVIVDGKKYAITEKAAGFLDRLKFNQEVEVSTGQDGEILFIGAPRGGGVEPRKNFVPSRASPNGAPVPSSEKKGDWPTKEEREATQKRIGRQACLNTAVEILKTQLLMTPPDAQKKLADTADAEKIVLAVAERLEKWVLRP